MEQATTRDVLNDLAAAPIGSAALQVEADRVAQSQQRGLKVKASEDLQETAKRASKLWLPQGKRRVTRDEAIAANRAFYANQIDLEDAVEAAGGKRGGARA